MTILEIESAAAALLSDAGQPVTVADFTVGGQDIALMLLNQIRLTAEMSHDFNFQRKLLTLSVDSVAGASLDDAVIQGTNTTVDLKTVVEVGMFDVYGNFRPVEWTTVEEGQERTRAENPFWGIRYPTDGQAASWPLGERRYVIRDNRINLWPTTQMPAQAIPLGIEAYVFSAAWTGTTITVTGTTAAGAYTQAGTFNGLPIFARSDFGFFILYSTTNAGWIISPTSEDNPSDPPGYWLLVAPVTQVNPHGTYTSSGTPTGSPVVTSNDATNDVWLTKASQYLLWQLVVNLNLRFKFFVPRTEGNLPPPQALADQGLETFKQWDIFKYEQFRRHGR